MSDPSKINRKTAEELFLHFAPMFAEFEKQGIDYCLVGGLAVIVHCLARDFDYFRATQDADAMVSQSYSNSDFAQDYLRVYATDPTYSKAIYEAIFGTDGFEELNDVKNAFINISFIGADEDLDGIETPDFDVCRMLNGRTLATIKRERLSVLGQDIWIATVDELLAMKQDTVAIYGSDFQTSSRPQDFIDINILSKLLNNSMSNT